MDNLPFFPVQASSVAGEVDLLLLLLIGLSGFFTSIVVILIFFFGIRYRRGNEVDRSNPPTTNLKMELGWIFGLLFLSSITYIWASIIYLRVASPPEENNLEVYAIGLQWMWKFQHPEGPREINELHVPVGRPVKMIMTSQDVIHSLYIPAFRVKYDVIPGRYTNLWFTPTRTGVYQLFCTEYCGTGHSRMIGQVVVLEPREYQEWLSGAPVAGQDAAEEGVPIAEAGQQLFQQLGCSSCHNPDATALAPSLVGLFAEPVPLEDGSTVIADENYIRESILFPNEKIVAGYEPIMPTYEGRVTEEQLVDLVAYIKSLGNETGTGEGTSDETNEGR